MKYDCDNGKHKFSREGVCELCNTKNTKVWGNKGWQVRHDRMPVFHVKFTIATFGEHETLVRASSLGCATTRIRYALRDLFSQVGGGEIIEIKEIKGDKGNE